MKNKALLSLLILASLAISAIADSFSGQGTMVSTNTSYHIAPASGGIPRVQSLAVISDVSTGVTTFYGKGTNVGPWAISDATNSTNITVIGHTLVSNDVVAVRSSTLGKYERLIVWGNSSNTVYLTTTPTTALAAGDIVWRMSAMAKLRVGSTNREFMSESQVFVGSENWPLMTVVTGTGTGNVNVDAITGDYLK